MMDQSAGFAPAIADSMWSISAWITWMCTSWIRSA
jgi:hypothetical protein